MKKVLAYLGCIGEIILSFAVFITFLATFAYLVTGLYPHLLITHGLNYFFLDASPGVLFVGVLILCGLSFRRGLNRLRKLLASESARTKLLLVVITFSIAEVGIVTWIGIFGHGFWRIPCILFISVLMFAIILSSIHDYKEAKTKKEKN